MLRPKAFSTDGLPDRIRAIRRSSIRVSKVRLRSDDGHTAAIQMARAGFEGLGPASQNHVFSTRRFRRFVPAGFSGLAPPPAVGFPHKRDLRITLRPRYELIRCAACRRACSGLRQEQRTRGLDTALMIVFASTSMTRTRLFCCLYVFRTLRHSVLTKSRSHTRTLFLRRFPRHQARRSYLWVRAFQGEFPMCLPNSRW